MMVRGQCRKKRKNKGTTRARDFGGRLSGQSRQASQRGTRRGIENFKRRNGRSRKEELEEKTKYVSFFENFFFFFSFWERRFSVSNNLCEPDRLEK